MSRLCWQGSPALTLNNIKDVRRRRRRLTWPVIAAVSIMVTTTTSGGGQVLASPADIISKHHERNHQLKQRRLRRQRQLDREGSTLANGGPTKSTAPLEQEEDDGMKFKDGTTVDLVSNPDYAAVDNASDPYWDIIKPYDATFDTDTDVDSSLKQETSEESSSEEYNPDDVEPSSISSETPPEEDISDEVRYSSGEVASASSAQLNPACNPNQHSLIFTLNTDMYSVSDNSWVVTQASFGDGQEVGNSGLYIASNSVGAGQLGFGAVVPQNMCADVANGASGHGDPNKSTVIDSRIVESCYDVEVYDANGDGLTQYWGPGGFSLTLDGTVVLEHRANLCEEDDVECAKKEGFDYCGARVCTVKYGGVGSAYATLDRPKMSPDTITLNTLSGSHCKLNQPLCQSSSDTLSIQVPLTVQVKTDSYADEVSWEVRVSKKNDPKKMDMANGLLLAGGSLVFGASSSTTSIPLIGQLGVGLPLEDNEEYSSTACLSMKDQCYDFRAYDAYGDGLGCGADGSITITLGEEIKLVQKDKDMAKRQKVYDGTKEKTVTEEACMDKTRLSKWSLCAVRICVDGEIIGLEGNQCAFGKGDELLDLSYNGTDPLNTMTALLEELDESEPPTFMPTTYMPTKKITEAPTFSSTVLVTNMQTLRDFDINIEDDPPTPSPSTNRESLRNFGINIDDELARPTQEEDNSIIEPREEQLDTWAEYYDALDPGFRDDPETMSDNNIPLPMWAKLDLREQDEEDEQKLTFDSELDDQDNNAVKKKYKKLKDKKGRESSTINDDDDDDETEDRQSVKKPKIKRKKNKDKKSDKNEEEKVMGYVSNQESIAEMQKNYDIVGDNNNIIYVWTDDAEAQTTKSKKHRDDEDEGRHLLVDSSVETRFLQSAKLSLWWCGVTYNDAVDSCGKRCTFGYGCPDGQLCFSVSGRHGKRCDNKKSKVKVHDFDIDVNDDDDDDDDTKSKRKGKMKQRTELLKKDSDDKFEKQRRKKAKQQDGEPRENVMGFDSNGKGVHDSNGNDRDEKKLSKIKEDENKMGKVDSKMSHDELHKGHELNVMGYVSANIGKNNEKNSDSDRNEGYEIINGNIHAQVNPTKNSKGKHRKMLRDADDR